MFGFFVANHAGAVGILFTVIGYRDRGRAFDHVVVGVEDSTVGGEDHPGSRCALLLVVGQVGVDIDESCGNRSPLPMPCMARLSKRGGGSWPP